MIFVSNEEDILKIKEVFEKYKLESGLIINSQKTKIMWYRNYAADAAMDKEWESVRYFSYLGVVIDNTGHVLWDDVCSKIQEKTVCTMEAVKEEGRLKGESLL